jgi:carbamoylphosphate synthase small subunit
MKETIPARLVLEDGTVSWGNVWRHIPAAGEVVFNTAMTGYPESLTDPSTGARSYALLIPW